MNRTSDYFLLKKPTGIPCIMNVCIPDSVTKMDPAPVFETTDGNLGFIISPAYMVSLSKHRKLAFSKEKEVQLNFSCIHAGTITIDQEEVYLFLERK